MGDEILPPHDTAAEAALLGAVFIRPPLIEKVAAVLVVDDFFHPWHREVYSAMLDVHAAGRPVDPVVVAGAMSKCADVAALMALAEKWSNPENAGVYAGRVREMAALRRLISIGVEVQSIGYARSRRAYEMATELIAAATAVARKMRPLKAVPNETTRRKNEHGK